MNVYFARSIKGQHSRGERPFLQAIVDTIRRQGHTPAIDMPKLEGVFDSTNEYIFKRDLWWLDQCQAMIAEVSNPSHGVGYEIAYANHVLNIPILVVAFKDTNVSAMLSGCFTVYEYRGISDLESDVETFLQTVVEQQKLAKA